MRSVELGANAIAFAVLGDLHGRFNRAVELLQRAEAKVNLRAAFVLQVGDMEAHRWKEDTESMYAPHRQKRLGDFPAYWYRKRTFPTHMFFIGGNHESYQRLDESPGGVEIAQNIHFLGRAGMVIHQGLKIAFLSGVFDKQYFHRLPEERAQVSREQDSAAQRFFSCYTETEVNRLNNIPRPDVLLVHEWPSGLVRQEDHEPLEPRHRHLRYGETGIPLMRQLVERLGPRLVLCGHMHRRYRGSIQNQYGSESTVICLGKVDDTEDGFEFFSYVGQEILPM